MPIILEYDPKVLNVNELPDRGEYNIVIPGFLDYSEKLSKVLIEKGYEILLYLPMGEKADALNFKAINKNSTFNDIRNIINFHTSRLNGENFVGFMNYGQNMQVNQSLPKMNFTMSLLNKTGHLFVDNTTQNNEQSLAYAAALVKRCQPLKLIIISKKLLSNFHILLIKLYAMVMA